MKKNLPRKGKGIAFNVSMLYIMNIAKLVFPLITLPYLTRVLSVDCYGVVSYVKATMVYAQLVVDFGFMLSGVKAITEAREDRELVGRITGNVILAKGMLSIASLAVSRIRSCGRICYIRYWHLFRSHCRHFCWNSYSEGLN